MSDQLDRYLNEVCWAMGGSFSEQQAARDELRAHVDEDVHEREIAGTPREDAVAAALRDLGDATAVGRALQASRGSAALRRPLVQPEGALILERRSAHHLPSAPMLGALIVALVVALLVSLVFLWPG